MSVVSLDENPEFDALSYAWGAPGNKLHFICSGQGLSVYENLGDFLQQASSLSRPRPIWIDAVCINQNDDSEKNWQIPLMGEIYSKAAEVLVWLGSGSREEQYAFAQIPVLREKFANAPTDPNSENAKPDPSSLGIPPWNAPLWGLYGTIFARAWFNRLWVLQEVLLNGNTTLLCGGQSINFETLVDFVRKLKVPPAFISNKQDHEVIQRAFRLLVALADYKERPDTPENQWNRMARISTILYSMVDREATNPVDKVFGALGVMPPDIQQSITVDVNMTQAQVYIAFTKCLIDRGDASLVLCFASHSMKVEGLPSWCPDFSERQPTRPFGSYPMIRRFAAGIEPVAVPSGKGQVTWLQDFKAIQVTGFEFDVVADVVKLDFVKPKRAGGTAVIEWDEACLNMAKRNINPSRHHQMYELLYDAMVGGARLKEFNNSRLPAPHWVQDHKDWRSSLESWMESGPPPSYMMPRTTERFNNSVHRASNGRRFFIGAKNLMGQGPRDIEAGDLICILYGQPTPFILRPNADGTTYRLLGEAYVNLIMNGQALRMKERYSIEDKTFVIT